jgi:protein-S-isoprenylcysteine O-methyltransferase Ste14
MATSRSTPRLRLTALLLAGLLAIVAVSQRTAATGLAGQLLQLAGLACVACAALGRIWCSVFIAGWKDAHLVRSGPYAALRHPLYALSLLAMLGLGLATRSVTITVGLLLVFAATYVAASRAEDRRLRVAYGDGFDNYAREVPAFLPRLARYTVPESLEVRPRVLWKAFLDAGSLLGLWALLMLADALQLAGRTPTWLTLP